MTDLIGQRGSSRKENKVAKPYEYWAERYGDLRHTNIDPKTGDYFEIEKQLSDCNLTREQLQSYIRWNYWTNQIQMLGFVPTEAARVRTTIDPYYDNPANKPYYPDPPPPPVVKSIEERLAEAIAEGYLDAKIVFGDSIYKGKKYTDSKPPSQLDRIESTVNKIVEVLKAMLS